MNAVIELRWLPSNLKKVSNIYNHIYMSPSKNESEINHVHSMRNKLTWQKKKLRLLEVEKEKALLLMKLGHLKITNYCFLCFFSSDWGFVIEPGFLLEGDSPAIVSVELTWLARVFKIDVRFEIDLGVETEGLDAGFGIYFVWSEVRTYLTADIV